VSGFQLLVPTTVSAPTQPDSRVRIALDRVIEEATRAGGVIYSLDCRGLQTAGLQAADNLKVGGLAPGAMEGEIRGHARDRVEFNRDTQEGLAYLAEQTGGFAVLNNNDLARGLARIAGDVRGYYVIGYVPQEGTFARQGQKATSHKISIVVKRPGLHVKTRKAFLGVSDPPTPRPERPRSNSSTPPRHRLRRRILRCAPPHCRDTRRRRACSCARCCTSTRGR
jgi:VWFA-related protein